MDSQTLRQVFLMYLEAHGHVIIGSASLIPEHDPSVLFTTAGMHPLVPYLLGEPHPAGKRLANVQKCLRTVDILEVGDAVHLTFFEMLGNWSLGDYWKPEAIQLTYVFLTEHLGLDRSRLWVTCFAGDEVAPRDDEAADVWRALGIPESCILFLSRDDNWWGPAGATGPCGPDSEVFYDSSPDGPPDETPATTPDRFWEICNNVFLQYDKQTDGSCPRLAQRSVDMGMGLERVLTILQEAPSVYETDLFQPILDEIRMPATAREPFAERVIADHVRATTMLLAEGLRPGNVDQPYIVRRLIRRAIRYGRELGIEGHFLARVAEAVIPTLRSAYPELERQRAHILAALDEEESRFQRTLARGEREFDKAVAQSRSRSESVLSGSVVFHLYDTYGFPAELTEEFAGREGLSVDMDGFRAAFAEHQERSRQGAAGRFRGGLAERIPETTQLHTATHLLHEALRRELGPHVAQRGSNITAERLRFDFSHGEKLTPEQLARIERRVNEQITRNLPVTWEEMALDEAQASGAIGLFEERYGEHVKVYSIGDSSREICGGPHVEQTAELGHFRITKEEAVGAGLRRIKAVLEN